MSDKKTQILKNALKMFLEYDYAGTSISMVTSSVGISKSTFFNYFKNKDELFNEVFLMCKANAAEVDCALLSAMENFEKHYRFYIENRSEIEFMNRFEYSEHITDESREKGISLNKKYYGDILTGQKNGTVTNVPPIYLCMTVCNAIVQSIDYVVIDGEIDKQKLEQIKNFVTQILFVNP